MVSLSLILARYDGTLELPLPVVSSHKLLSLLENSARYGNGVAFVCYGLMLTIILLG